MIYIMHIMVLFLTFGSVDLIEYDNVSTTSIFYEDTNGDLYTYRDVFESEDPITYETAPSSQELQDGESLYNDILSGSVDRSYTLNENTWVDLIILIAALGFWLYLLPKGYKLTKKVFV